MITAQQVPVRIYAPTGALGAGFSRAALARAIELDPHVIACDAGSTDSGPFALGSGTPKLSNVAVRRDLEALLLARDRLDVPLIIGSCATAGRDDGVDLVAGMVRDIAAEHHLSIRLARIYSDQDPADIEAAWRKGLLNELAAAPDLTQLDFRRSHIVGMMGVEPIEAAVLDGAQVVLAGRASDTALFAAVPHMMGADAGLTWHAAKTVECGAACAIPPGADSLFVHIHDDHFTVETLTPDRRLTPRSVAAHTLYENADPFLVTEPGGVLDTEKARYEAISDFCVKVSGAVFHPAEQYTIKLEGASLVGYQTVVIGGIRDAVVIEQLPALVPAAKAYFGSRIADLFPDVDPRSIDIGFRFYGIDAVLGTNELPPVVAPREIGVLITITAPSQQLAHDVGTFVAHTSSHLPIPQYDGLVSTIAYPFSPPEIDRGALYRFVLNHTIVPGSPTAMFRTEQETIR
ncbi:acyclic terpene utilization AtuA family protein [Rhodococcus sp. 077-4]|uniref:acyclic terpene utilization AtuA family protein n=1 Tax=Rhodococcus sp. 077-4 TaxID=2789271 RepID=UPI0039F45BC6